MTSTQGLLALFIFFAIDAMACKCLPTPLPEELDSASIAFIGSTDADPGLERRIGETIYFTISRPLKGGLARGSKVEIDPSFNSDCAAPFEPGVQFRVFAFERVGSAPVAKACSIRLVEPATISGELLQPESDVAEFLRSIGERLPEPES